SRPVESLLAVGRDLERCDAVERFVELTFFKIELLHGKPELARRGRSDRLFEDVDEVRFAYRQAEIIARWNRQRDDALINAVQINSRRLFFLRGRPGSAGRSLSVSLLLFSLSPLLLVSLSVFLPFF